VIAAVDGRLSRRRQLRSRCAGDALPQPARACKADVDRFELFALIQVEDIRVAAGGDSPLLESRDSGYLPLRFPTSGNVLKCLPTA
jgi:hypothetical protein